MPDTTHTDLIKRFEAAARKARPVAVGAAAVLALALSHPDKVEAEHLEKLHEEASATIALGVDDLAELQREAPAAVADTTRLEQYRNDDNPRLLPSGREAETLVFNLTGNWVVAIDDQGQPTFLPQNLSGLDFTVMGSLQERYRGQQGELTTERIKQDITQLFLAGSYSEEARRKLVKRLRVRLGIPTEGAEELDLEQRRDEDGNIIVRRGEETAEDIGEDALRNIQWRIEHGVEEKIEDIIW